jgi:hypothetical protein
MMLKQSLRVFGAVFTQGGLMKLYLPVAMMIGGLWSEAGQEGMTNSTGGEEGTVSRVG